MADPNRGGAGIDVDVVVPIDAVGTAVCDPPAGVWAVPAEWPRAPEALY